MLKEWKRIEADIINELGRPVVQINKQRGNTHGKGVLEIYSDGTIAFKFDSPPPGTTLERARAVLYTNPVDGESLVSINSFANAYNIPCGNTGQKNGKEWAFGKKWRSDDNYIKYVIFYCALLFFLYI